MNLTQNSKLTETLALVALDALTIDAAAALVSMTPDALVREAQTAETSAAVDALVAEMARDGRAVPARARGMLLRLLGHMEGTMEAGLSAGTQAKFAELLYRVSGMANVREPAKPNEGFQLIINIPGREKLVFGEPEKVVEAEAVVDAE
jgi:hypothetical protein